MENKRTDYSKEKSKSNPTGIRFNLGQEKIAMAKTGLKTRQKLVDYLLEDFVNGENPVLSRGMKREGELVAIATKAAIATLQDYTQPTHQVKPITDEKPITNYEVKIEPKPISSVMGDFEGMKKEIFACETIAQIKEVDKKIKVALFSFRQKAELENLAKQHSATLYND